MELSHEFLKECQTFFSYDDFSSNFKINIPENFNFSYDIVDRYAEKTPSKRALVWCNDNGLERTFSFLEISQKSQQTANFLSSVGIKKGDTVMLMLRRQYEYWFFVLALHRIGAIAIPAAEQLLANDIEYRLNSADVKLLVISDSETLASEVGKINFGGRTKVVGVGGNVNSTFIDYYKEIDKYSCSFPRPLKEKSTSNKDTMLIFFTSGTSAFPKMVMHDYTYPLSHIVTAKYWQQVRKDGLHFSMAETGWAKSSWGKIYGQWICGSAVFVYDRKGFFPERILEKLQKYQITTFCAPSTIYRYLTKANKNQFDLSCVEHFCTAGEALNEETRTKFEKLFGKQIYEGYGQTETSIITANFPWMKIKNGSIGKASPLYNIDVIDKNGNSCKNGETGELVIKLDKIHPLGLLSGYYKDDSLSKEIFKDGVYHTKDNVFRDNNGYFWFVCRTDDIIKSSGFRISPLEIENILQKHPAVSECAVTGVPDTARGMAIKATIVLSSSYNASNELQTELINFVKQQTALYKAPRIINFVDELPKTFNGKIKRNSIN